MLGGEGLVADAPWPRADPALLVEDSVTLPIQINGKRRAEITVGRDVGKPELEKLVLEHEAVTKALEGRAPKKLIVVPGPDRECRHLTAASFFFGLAALAGCGYEPVYAPGAVARSLRGTVLVDPPVGPRGLRPRQRA